MDFFATLAMGRELRSKLNYIIVHVAAPTEKVNQIELTVNLERMSEASLVEDSEDEKLPPAVGGLFPTAKSDQA